MNKLLTLAIAGLLSLTMAGCAATATEVTELTIDNNDSLTTLDRDEENRTDEGYYISTTDDMKEGDVITVGDIMQFDGKYIHIISGDLVEVFEYDNTNEKDFYIGQTVQLVKGNESDSLEVFEREDYTILHTNMGQMIEQITGTIEKITDKMITVKTDSGNVEIKTYEPVEGQVGDKVTVYAMTFDTEKSAIMTLNESSKMMLTIAEITRSEEGIMQLLLTDENDGEYSISASHVSVEFDITKLAVGDELSVYYKGGVMESWPMQLNVVMIRK